MKEGDVVLCTVSEVTNTVTSVKLETGEEGTIISSEIAPGRIKHMRQYVVPNKKIVCKVLGTSGGRINLSLRRVSSREKKEVMEKYKQEQALNTGFKQIFNKESEEIIKNILCDFESLQDFINKAKEDESFLKKYIPLEKYESIKRMLEKKKKSHELKYNLSIKCLEEDGMSRVKKILEFSDEKILINYISAGNFKLRLIVEDFKEGKKKMSEIIKELEKRAKENHCEFFASEEK
jgi:translation initiation factor 2 alpha subunit (eIF-2alpha)